MQNVGLAGLLCTNDCGEKEESIEDKTGYKVLSSF